MSITLMAYPVAFLISPQQAKGETLKLADDCTETNKSVAVQNLKSIRVLTNIEYTQLSEIMSKIDCEKVGQNEYKLSSGLNVKWKYYDNYLVANLYGSLKSELLQELGEQFFAQLDACAGRNVRIIDSSEIFYYNYSTSYKKIQQIYSQLKEKGATEIYTTDKNEVIAKVDGQNVRYYLNDNDDSYTLEVEQKITILNIGLSADYQGNNVSYGLTNLKIKTNIKADELKTYLKKANYLLYHANMQTPLKNSNATLNWILKDGYYVAEFSGDNNSAITKEAEIIFRKMNIVAGRDLRRINDISTAVYTYKTNYTDKGTLINTLTEHGAQELLENGDEISCKLFGMEMIYYKKNDTDSYTLDITQVSDVSDCKNIINDLNDEYGLNIQEMTYNKIKERLDKENMRLESESVMDDNSIVLTIEI